MTRFEKTSFELTVTKIFKIKLQYRKILAQVFDFVKYIFFPFLRVRLVMLEVLEFSVDRYDELC